jgi:nucleotide-binding universal stress UspA family protein
LLRALDDGSYRRADLPADIEARSTAVAVEPPWRRILCLVEFEDDDRDSLTAASHSALAYATTLAVTHRARITALHLVSSVAAKATEQQNEVEQLVERIRRHVLSHSLPGLIDVHVATGASNEDLFQAAGELRADLIVVGKHGKSGWESMLLGSVARRVIQEAACDVLVVERADADAG